MFCFWVPLCPRKRGPIVRIEGNTWSQGRRVLTESYVLPGRVFAYSSVCANEYRSCLVRVSTAEQQL